MTGTQTYTSPVLTGAAAAAFGPTRPASQAGTVPMSARGSEAGGSSRATSGPATGKADGIDIDVETAGAGTLYVQESYVRARGVSTNGGDEKDKDKGRKGGPSGTNRSLSRGGRIGRSKGKDGKDEMKRKAASSASTSRSRGRRRSRDWEEWPPAWETVCKDPEDLLAIESPDLLLDRGIAEYTFLPAPGGLLGKGKFSTVYKVIDSQGKYVELILQHALKHTPLHPHHPLIAARLLREPTLLAHLPTHPCLIKVDGWIRTAGHFYLVEEYASRHVPLPALPLPVRPSQAAYILDQLVSVIRDCLHYGRVCHRDLKGENVMVDPETGDIIVLDLGLATQFTMDEPKLTTCCGSPAFHSPEIVHALNHPPGAVTYFGPELDIWCTALTLLSLLLYIRYPLGPKHRSRRIMGSRVSDVLRQLDHAYPPSRPAGRWKLSEAEHQFEQREWVRVRRALAMFLDINGARRMVAFKHYTFGTKMQARLLAWQRSREEGEEESDEFRQLSFVKGVVKHPLPLSVLHQQKSTDAPRDVSEIEGGALGLFGPKSGVSYGQETDGVQFELDGIPESSVARSMSNRLVLSNPTSAPEDRVISFLKYLFRTNGILYHAVADDPHTLFQLILPVRAPAPPATPSVTTETPTEDSEAGDTKSKGWLPDFLRSKGPKAPKAPRSVSLPARPPSVPRRSSVEESDIRYLRCMARIEFDDRQHRPPSAGLGNISMQNGSNGSSASLATMDSLASAARSLSAHASLGMTKKHAAGTWTLSPRSPLPMIVPSTGEIMGMETPPGFGDDMDDTTPNNESPQSLAMASLQHALLRIHTGREASTSTSPSAYASATASQPVSPTSTPGSATPSAEQGIFSALPARPHSKPGNPRAASQPRISLHTQALRAYKGSEASLGHFVQPPAQSPTLGPISLPASRVQSRAGSRSSSVAPGSSRMPSRAPSLSTASLKSPHLNGRQLSRESTFASPESLVDEPPRVILYFSDGRAVSPIRRAVEACQPPEPVSGDMQPESPAQAIPITYPETTYDDDAAPERGRPRSRDEKYLGGASPLDWQGPGRYMRVRTSVKAVGKEGDGGDAMSGHRDSKERDNSRGRRLLQSLFGSAGLAAAYAGMQETGPVGLAPSDSGIRSVSVPPHNVR